MKKLYSVYWYKLLVILIIFTSHLNHKVPAWPYTSETIDRVGVITGVTFYHYHSPGFEQHFSSFYSLPHSAHVAIFWVIPRESYPNSNCDIYAVNFCLSDKWIVSMVAACSHKSTVVNWVHNCTMHMLYYSDVFFWVLCPNSSKKLCFDDFTHI